MAHNPYFSVVTSKTAFEQKFRAESRKRFNEMRPGPASDWGREHLFACRVVRRPGQPKVLPMLSRHASPLHGPIPDEVAKFVAGPERASLDRSEHDLVREHGLLGQVWAALAVFQGSEARRLGNTEESNVLDGGDDAAYEEEGQETEDDEDDEEDEEDEDDGDEESATRHKRVRRGTMQDDFVDSGKIQAGSSSPLSGNNSQQTASSGLEYIDNTSHALLIAPEDGTIRLASSVVRYILLFSPPQDGACLPSVVEFRDAKCRLQAQTKELECKLVATDDGGLCLRQTLANVSQVVMNRVAILEAKNRFHFWHEGVPIISDKSLAQMTCEALVARLADPMRELKQERVILINATQHYLCFLEFEITAAYLDDFESAAPTQYLEFVWTNLRAIMSLASE